jgi:hypothetical protein
MVDSSGVPVGLTTSVACCNHGSALPSCQDPDSPGTCLHGEACNGSNALCANHWPGYNDRSSTAVTPLRTRAALDT